MSSRRLGVGRSSTASLLMVEVGYSRSSLSVGRAAATTACGNGRRSPRASSIEISSSPRWCGRFERPKTTQPRSGAGSSTASGCTAGSQLGRDATRLDCGGSSRNLRGKPWDGQRVIRSRSLSTPTSAIDPAPARTAMKTASRRTVVFPRAWSDIRRRACASSSAALAGASRAASTRLLWRTRNESWRPGRRVA